MTQTKIIMIEIERQIENGLSTKREIFANVVETLGVPRPTVRRCSSQLVKEMKRKVMVLADDSRISDEIKSKILNIDWNKK